MSALFDESKFPTVELEFDMRESAIQTVISVYRRFEAKYLVFKKYLFDLLKSCLEIKGKNYSLGKFYAASKCLFEISCYFVLENVFPRLAEVRETVQTQEDQARLEKLEEMLRVEG